jgi:hypothetical protein
MARDPYVHVSDRAEIKKNRRKHFRTESRRVKEQTKGKSKKRSRKVLKVTCKIANIIVGKELKAKRNCAKIKMPSRAVVWGGTWT